jgi:putative transposase
MPRNREAIKNDNQLLHVINRGVKKDRIFFGPEDYALFIGLLTAYLNPDDIRIWVYCLMPNHFHLLLWQRFAYGVSSFMQRVCGDFAQIINKRYERTGHLFQGRFKPVAMEDPASALRVSWYIHQNPVAARLSKTPEDWQYSSMGELVGSIPPRFASLDCLTNLVGGKEEYLKFMAEYDPLEPGSAWLYLA